MAFLSLACQIACAPRIISIPPMEVPVSPCAPGKEIFSYTGSLQSFTLNPSCVLSPQVYVKMWGAGGGGGIFTYDSPTGNFGGAGGYVGAALNTDPTQAYSILVGGGGQPLSGGFAGGFGEVGMVPPAAATG